MQLDNHTPFIAKIHLEAEFLHLSVSSCLGHSLCFCSHHLPIALHPKTDQGTAAQLGPAGPIALAAQLASTSTNCHSHFRTGV